MARRRRRSRDVVWVRVHGKFDPEYGPDDETPEGNRAAIEASVSYDDLPPELEARLKRMRQINSS